MNYVAVAALSVAKGVPIPRHEVFNEGLAINLPMYIEFALDRESFRLL